MNQITAAARSSVKLDCGLCLREGIEYAVVTGLLLDSQMAMLTHWHYTHKDAPVPAFTQDTWRTGIVYPLEYAPIYTMQLAAQSSGIGVAMEALDEIMVPTEPLTLTVEPVKAQVMVREMRESPLQKKVRYQCYVRVGVNGAPIYFLPKNTIDGARLDRDQLVRILALTIGVDNVTVLDYI